MQRKKRVLLVAIKNSYNYKKFLQLYDEFIQLVKSADKKIVQIIDQNLKKINPGYFISRGKLEEIKYIIYERDIEEVIFLNQLSAVQQRNLQQFLKCRVYDKNALILDIFSKRAKTYEGKIQVKLAQLTYQLSRITYIVEEMSRLGGGIGTRGPGEKQLERDKRNIKRQINSLRKEIEKLKKTRKLHRENRAKKGIFHVNLVGYTNAGKTTLLNALTKSNEFVEDKLFATLDPTTRKMYIDKDRYILITDTVGFIRDLPIQLVSAFNATLEEIPYANLILKVIDGSSRSVQDDLKVINNTLHNLKAEDIPSFVVVNKKDKMSFNDIVNIYDFIKDEDYIILSAFLKADILRLIEKIKRYIQR